MLFVVRCAVCERPGARLCPVCAAELVPAPLVAVPPGLDRFVALLSYEGAGRQLVADLKFRNGRALGTTVTEPLADLVRAVLDTDHAPWVVTWAPTSAQRRRARGYDQAQLLARRLAKRLDLPVRGLLRRSGQVSQTGRSRIERLDGPRFVARGRVAPSVLLLDDVRTSGATFSAAANALRARGAEWLIGVALAQTPLNHPASRADTSP